MIKGVIFDLDDTLYLERDYVRSGFEAVSKELKRISGYNDVELFSFLWQSFLDGIRRNTFDLLLKQYPFLKKCVPINDLISIYRNHKPNIQLLPGAYSTISRLKHEGFQLGIISDGPVVSQQAKVKALNLNEIFDTVILTDYWGKEYWKPHPRAFKECAARFHLAHYQLCYVADNIQKDFVVPRKLGWKTIQLFFPGQLYKHISGASIERPVPDVVVKDFNEILDVILAKQGEYINE